MLKETFISVTFILFHVRYVDCEESKTLKNWYCQGFTNKRRPTLVRQEGNLVSGYKNTDLKCSRKRIELSPEVQVHRLFKSNRSALTDHAVQENHVISWSAASVIDRESDRSIRRIKEAVHIRKEGPRSMNRDEGSYQLSHTYDRFLGSTLTCRAKNRKKKT